MMIIRNCKQPGGCPADWDSLVKTAQEDVRYCPHCDRGVHLCTTDAQLKAAMQADQCVAIPSGEGEDADTGKSFLQLHMEDDTYFEQ